MGYILPVTNHQYSDYQKRVTETKRKPHTIDTTYKVILEKQYEELKKQYKPMTRESIPIEKSASDENIPEVKIPGIGENVNEKV